MAMYKKLLIVLLFLVPSMALAQSQYQPLEPLPFLNDAQNVQVPNYLQAAFRIAMILGAVLAVVMITYGGIQYMTSDVLGTKAAGRERIKNATLGLLLLLGTYLILFTINPNLVRFDLLIPPTGGEFGSTLPGMEGPRVANPRAQQTGQAIIEALRNSGQTQITAFPDSQNPVLQNTGTLTARNGTTQFTATFNNYSAQCQALGGQTKTISTGGGTSQVSLQCWK